MIVHVSLDDEIPVFPDSVDEIGFDAATAIDLPD